MTYKLIKSQKIERVPEIDQYVFENSKPFKRWYLDFDPKANTVSSLICSGVWEDFRHRRHCVPKVINEFIEQLQLMNML